VGGAGRAYSTICFSAARMSSRSSRANPPFARMPACSTGVKVRVRAVNRLSQISTLGTLIRKARAGNGAAAEALELLFLRYQKAVYQYACSLLHDANEATEVCSAFAHKLHTRQLTTAAENVGSFRQLLKKTVHDLAMSRLRKDPGKAPRLLPDEEPAGGNVFDSEWGELCLQDAWDLLEEGEMEQPYPRALPYYTVLRLQADNRGASLEDLVRLLSRSLGEEVTAEQFRQWRAEARLRFAHYLLEVLEQELGDEGQGNVVTELKELGLYNYCKSALESRGLVP
jgi:DNA-directed RNA polymerase specialized sigma24 family protein